MRLVRELGPLAAATAAVLAATTWALAEQPGVGRWALAAILFAHGWVHLMYLVPRPSPPEPSGAAVRGGLDAAAHPAPEWPFDLGRSWLVERVGAGEGAVRAVGRWLVVVTFFVSMVAAIATAWLAIPAAWWAVLVAAAAAGSLALLVVAFARSLVIGIAIDAWLLWIALAGPWSP
jgi:hypothetical protein